MNIFGKFQTLCVLFIVFQAFLKFSMSFDIDNNEFGFNYINQIEENDLFLVETIKTENLSHPDTIELHKIQLYEPKSDSKIIAGREAKPNQFPYQVAIYIFGYSGRVLFCGGSVISREYVITAAHCIFEKPKRILVIMGNTKLLTYNKNEVRRDVEKYILHKKFNREALSNDICLLLLRGSVNFSKSIAPIALPNLADINKNFLNRIATVSGFGKTRDGGDTSRQLMYIDLNIMDNEMCNSWFEDRDATYTNICTSGTDGRGACQGDSGGPLVIDKKLIGLVSYGALYCSWGYPTVYTRVPSYIKWIANYTKIPIH